MKRKEDNDNLLSQTSYWDMKLGINHITEKARYKKLCGCNLSKYDKKDLDGTYYISFSDWKENMDGKLSILNQEELLEYSKYINWGLEKENGFEGLFSNYIFPFLIAIISPLITDIFVSIIVNVKNSSINDFWVCIVSIIICMFSFFFLVKYMVKNIKDDIEDNKVNYLFYKDMHELVISKMQ